MRGGAADRGRGGGQERVNGITCVGQVSETPQPHTETQIHPLLKVVLLAGVQFSSLLNVLQS